MITFRTHTCGELNKSNKGQDVSLSGWVHKKGIMETCFLLT